MPGLERVIARLRAAVERFLGGERRGLMLTVLAASRLRERGEEITAKAVAEEGRRIIEETRGRMDWGVTESEYTAEKARELLDELVDMGVLERVDGGYRFARHDSTDIYPQVMDTMAPIVLRMRT